MRHCLPPFLLFPPQVKTSSLRGKAKTRAAIVSERWAVPQTAFCWVPIDPDPGVSMMDCSGGFHGAARRIAPVLCIDKTLSLSSPSLVKYFSPELMS